MLSPGGSIIYSQKCKEHLSSCYKVFLDASLETIRKRLTDAEKRGIVSLKKMGLEALYFRRKKLYSEYADIIMDAGIKNEEKLVKAIVNNYHTVLETDELA